MRLWVWKATPVGMKSWAYKFIGTRLSSEKVGFGFRCVQNHPFGKMIYVYWWLVGPSNGFGSFKIQRVVVVGVNKVVAEAAPHSFMYIFVRYLGGTPCTLRCVTAGEQGISAAA